MEQIGQGGSRVLSEVWAEQAPPQSRLLPEVEGLRQIWTQQLFWQERQFVLDEKL